jgi:hypothetical protein
MSTFDIVQSIALILCFFIIGSFILDGFLAIIGGCLSFASSYFIYSLLEVYFGVDSSTFLHSVLFVTIILVLIRTSREKVRKSLSRINLRSTGPYLILGTMLFGVTAASIPPVIGWDARSIWIFHARWLMENEIYSNYQRDPINFFSHPDYPIAGSSSLAFFGNLAGGEIQNMVRGFAFIQFSIAFYIGIVVSNICIARKSLRAILSFFLTASILVLGSNFGITSGYMDLANAIGISAIFVTLVSLVGNPKDQRLKIMLFLLTVYTSGLKQESGVLILVITIAWEIAQRISKSRASNTVFIYIGLALTNLSWRFYQSIEKIPNTSDVRGIFSNLPTNLSDLRDYFPYLREYFSLGGDRALFVTVFTIALVSILQRTKVRSELVQKRAGIITVFLLHAVLIATYTLGDSRKSLDWWMSNSFDRIILTSYVFSLILIILAISPFNLININGTRSLVSRFGRERNKARD